MRHTPPVVLTFAATDPTSGAGLQADLLTLSSIGCHPVSVVTAITVQDTLGVDNVLVFDAEWVEEQARAVLEDMEVVVFKLGMLGSVENITVIAEIIADYPDALLLIDPILASGRGDELASEDMISAMRELLIPQTTLITPNSLEARRLAQDDSNENDDPDLNECARRLLNLLENIQTAAPGAGKAKIDGEFVQEGCSLSERSAREAVALVVRFFERQDCASASGVNVDGIRNLLRDAGLGAPEVVRGAESVQRGKDHPQGD